MSTGNGGPQAGGPPAGLDLVALTQQMAAEAGNAAQEAAAAAEWRRQMQAGQLVMAGYLERIAASLERLEAQAQQMGGLGALAGMMGARRRPGGPQQPQR